LQNLFHDGGFSNMGISTAIMDDFMKVNQPKEVKEEKKSKK
jgi:enoyl-[acyl-carrier protein] reductase I